MRRDFFLGDKKIENVRMYKYLGLVFTPSGEIKTGLQDLKARSQRALCALMSKLGEFFQKSFSVTLKLFHALIKPILLYLAGFWGNLKMAPFGRNRPKFGINLAKMIKN